MLLSPAQNLQHLFVSSICCSAGHDNSGQTIVVQFAAPSQHKHSIQLTMECSPCSRSNWFARHFSIAKKRNDTEKKKGKKTEFYHLILVNS